jgi:hypothetical protein
MWAQMYVNCYGKYGFRCGEFSATHDGATNIYGYLRILFKSDEKYRKLEQKLFSSLKKVRLSLSDFDEILSGLMRFAQNSSIVFN